MAYLTPIESPFPGSGASAYETFTVTLSSAAASPVTVHYATADDTAKAGLDYSPAGGTLTFATGQTTATVSVLLLSDPAAQSNLDFLLQLSNAGGATIVTATGKGVITR